MNKHTGLNGFLLAALATLAIACNQGNQKELDTPTSGEINLGVDETFMPLADAELQAFHGLYKRAKVNVAYKPEAELVRDLQRDSARAIMISRELTKNETQIFDQIKIRIKPLKVAVDGIAVLLHPDNPADSLTITELAEILAGKTSNWSQVPNGQPRKLVLVFDNPNSSTVRYLADSVLNNQAIAGNAFAAKTNPEVVNYVAGNRNAIGIIGLSWISDKDDTLSTSFLKKVKVAALKENRPGRVAGEYCQPYQAYLSPKSETLYPLRRNVYFISREARSGLATGFVTFVASERGQRVVLKSGLLPATMPIRLVTFGDEKKLGNRPGATSVR